jgi:hypothetical protein
MNTNSKLLAIAAVALAFAFVAPTTVGQTATTGYGTQVKLGDSDHIPVTGATSIALAVVHIDFGVVGDVNDDCTYLDIDASGTVTNFDVRMTPCQGKAVGSTIVDSDTVEKSAAGAIVTTTAIVPSFADVNNNGRYDSGDYVYADTTAGAGIVATTGPTVYTLRITPAGGKAAGTYVFAGDSDFVSYGAATSVGTVFSVAWFDADLSAAGAFTTGDSPYLVPVAAGLAAGSVFPLNSVRLGGPQVVSGGNPSGNTGTGTGTGTSTMTGTGTETGTGTGTQTGTGTGTGTVAPTGTQGQTTSDNEEEDDNQTPGFELVALVGALAVALVLVRRKL